MKITITKSEYEHLKSKGYLWNPFDGSNIFYRDGKYYVEYAYSWDCFGPTSATTQPVEIELDVDPEAIRVNFLLIVSDPI